MWAQVASLERHLRETLDEKVALETELAQERERRNALEAELEEERAGDWSFFEWR